MTEKETTGELFNFNELPSRDYLEQRQALIDAFCAVRQHSEQIASPFSPEDQQLQSMPEASQAVSNAQWIEFIDGGGYDNPMLWLADGWAWKCENDIRAPLYWYRATGSWYRRTLMGAESVPPNDPVSHLSYYEALAIFFTAPGSGFRLIA